MKINKLIIRIAHLFGFMKNQEHIDDVHIRLDTEYNTDDYWSEDPYIVDDIKKQIYQYFENDIKLKQRATNVNSIYVSFYKIVDGRPKIKDTTYEKMKCETLKCLMYKNGVLYYPKQKNGYDDVESYVRDCKIEKIVENDN